VADFQINGVNKLLSCLWGLKKWRSYLIVLCMYCNVFVCSDNALFQDTLLFRKALNPGSFFLVSPGGVRLSPLGTSATVGVIYKPRMIDDDDNGAVGGMRIGRGNRSTRRKPAPVPLCPPQIPRDLTWDRTRAAAVGNQRLTA
jgi:hypothetical protein